MSGLEFLNQHKLWVLVDGVAGTILQQSGPVGCSLVKNGAGNYTLTLDPGLDRNFGQMAVGVRGGAATSGIQADWLANDTTINVLTDTAGAPADKTWELTLTGHRAP